MNNTRNLSIILQKLKDMNYKWWKKQDSYNLLKKEVVMEIGYYYDKRALNKLNMFEIFKVKDILDSLIVFEKDINLQNNHLLAINEEIIEYIIDRLNGKDGTDELVDILIFLHLYLKQYYPEDFKWIDRRLHNDLYEMHSLEVRAFQLGWMPKRVTFEIIHPLYLYCLMIVSKEDLVEKINYNNIRSDHKSYKVYV